MIAQKMKPLVENNSVIRVMFEEGKRMAAQYGAENVFDFSLGNPNVPAPEAVNDAIREVLDTEESTFVHGYMSNAGYEDVRKAVADSLNQRFGTHFHGGNIVMASGAAAALNAILKAVLDPGDEVVTFAPYFMEYGNYVRNYDAVLVVVPPDTSTFQPDIKAFEEKITEKTKAVIVNTPHNPTGVIYSEEAIRGIASVLEKKQKEYGHAIVLISDEPYRELVYDGAQVPYLTKYYDNTVVCYSYSKSLSLPGERIGYLVIPDELEDSQAVVQACVIALRVTGHVNAPSLMQRVIMRCLNEKTDVDSYDRNRRLLYEELSRMGFDCVKPQGAFYLFVKAPSGDDKEFSARAKKYNILIVPGSSFACPGYVRVSYCVAYDTIKNSLPGFKKLAAEYGL